MKYAQLLAAIDSTSQRLVGRAAAAVNQALVIRNWLIGAYIVEFEQHGEDRARYGTRLLPRLAEDLKKRDRKGFGVSMLELMRRFYQVYPQLAAKISQPLVTEFAPRTGNGSLTDSVTTGHGIAAARISPSTKSRKAAAPLASPEMILQFQWSHLLQLTRIEDPLKRAFYENECLKGNWSKRQLQRQIGSLLFERTGLSKNKAAVLHRAQSQGTPADVADLLRDPYVLEFTGLAERPEYTESELEAALLDHLQQFLLELGTGFCFEARQKRISVGNEHDYIDLVFYHRRLRCHVLVELKTRPFNHGDAGQMNFYLNWWKKHGTDEGDQLPVGILLCTDQDRTKVEFATAGMDNKLFVSRYLVALPSPKQLQEFIERDREEIEAQMTKGRD